MEIAPWAEKALKAFQDAEKEFDPEKVKIGDVITFWHNPYQHSPRIKIYKINKKSWRGTEIEGSYQSGADWYIPKDTPGLHMAGSVRLLFEEISNDFGRET